LGEIVLPSIFLALQDTWVNKEGIWNLRLLRLEERKKNSQLQYPLVTEVFGSFINPVTLNLELKLKFLS